MSITVEGLVKRFGDFLALDRVSICTEPVAWRRCSDRPGRARPRCCAALPGWRRPTAAASATPKRRSRTRSAKARNVGFVFQHYALFRHMSVFENVAFACVCAAGPR